MTDQTEPVDDPTTTVLIPGDAASADKAKEISIGLIRSGAAELDADPSGFVARSAQVDHLGLGHTRVQQLVDNVPVFGGGAVIHLDDEGALRSVTDRFVAHVRVNTTPKISDFTATDLAVGRSGGWGALSDVPAAELMVLRHEGADYLTYRVSLEQLDQDQPSMPVLFIDAHTGDLVMQYDNLQTARNRRTYDGNNGSSLPGSLRRTEGQGPTGDGPVDAAHDNAGDTYDCYAQNFGRDSYDDRGATMYSTAHHRSNYNNAFWNGSQMVYGDGDGSVFTPLSESLDVVAHELTHAVTDESSDLIYRNQSGALNEAMSDILAAYCEAWHDGSVNGDVWKIGDEIYTPGTSGDALRYMNNPTIDGSSYDYYPTRYTGSADNGGVHWNSGIANLAFYLLSVGGTHPRGETSNSVPAIGIEKAGQIFYRANNVYLTASSNFESARNATASAANDLYGQTEVDAVQAAWDAVGVPGGGAPPPPPGCPWQPGDYDYCKDCGPCEDGEGDCDGNGECVAGTVCAQDVGANYGWPSNVDVCEEPSSSCPWPLEHWNYCRDCGPCQANEGDCDGNGECAAGTRCVNNVGADYGWPSSVDVCR